MFISLFRSKLKFYYEVLFFIYPVFLFSQQEEKSKGSGLFFGPGIGAGFQIKAIELLIEPTCFI
jgi:hypothetical protein